MSIQKKENVGGFSMKLIRKVALPSMRRANGEGAICFGGWFSIEDPMDREDTFWAGGEPVLAREPNPGYTVGMIRVTRAITINEEEIHQRWGGGRILKT
jgi:hypothetical protein